MIVLNLAAWIIESLSDSLDWVDQVLSWAVHTAATTGEPRWRRSKVKCSLLFVLAAKRSSASKDNIMSLLILWSSDGIDLIITEYFIFIILTLSLAKSTA